MSDRQLWVIMASKKKSWRTHCGKEPSEGSATSVKNFDVDSSAYVLSKKLSTGLTISALAESCTKIIHLTVL